MGPPPVCHPACGDDPFGYIWLKIHPSWLSKNKAAWHTYNYQPPASIRAYLKLKETLCHVFDTCMSPLWGPLRPYMHSTVAFLLSHKCIRKSGRLLMGSSTRGSWGGRYIQPIMKSPSTWGKDIQFASLIKQNVTLPRAVISITNELFFHLNKIYNLH